MLQRVERVERVSPTASTTAPPAMVQIAMSIE
jgi:hypothetical protein